MAGIFLYKVVALFVSTVTLQAQTFANRTDFLASAMHASGNGRVCFVSPKPLLTMENFDEPTDVGTSSAPSRPEGLRITTEIQQYWRQIGQWSLFFAILLFIVFGIVAIVGLVAAIAGGAAGLIGGLLVVGIYAVILFFPGLYFYRFYTQLKSAFQMDDVDLLDLAFINLRRFYRHTGILLIVLLAVYALVLLVFGTAMMNNSFPD
jgi:hypothetical protein